MDNMETKETFFQMALETASHFKNEQPLTDKDIWVLRTCLVKYLDKALRCYANAYNKVKEAEQC